MKPIRLIPLAAIFVSGCATSSPQKMTTLDDYKKVLEDRYLGPLCYAEIARQASIVQIGKVSVTFQIPAAGGRVQNLEVTQGKENTPDLAIALLTISKLSAPPVPKNLLSGKKYVSFEESFTVYEQQPVGPRTL